MALKNAVGDRIVTYCIFDSDYHTRGEKDDRYNQAKERGINVHIWERKEIENYLLEPRVIARTITRRTTKAPPTPAQVATFLLHAADDEKDNTLDVMAVGILNEDRKLGVAGANKAAREQLKKRWEHERLHLVSGKALLSRLSTWAQAEYGASIGAMTLARAFKSEEVPQEVRTILTSIQEGAPFPGT